MKQTLVSKERILEETKKAIAETLGADAEAIQAENSLTEDLEAQSLDFLDINFRLEQTFGIKMARHFVLEHVEELFGEGSAIDENSEITDKAVRLLKMRMGEDYPVEAGMSIDDLPALVTVQTFANGVEDILDSLPEKCAACGAKSWKANDGAHIVCSSCNRPAEFRSGDDLIDDWLREVNQRERLF
jgi:acyl carrier protein